MTAPQVAVHPAALPAARLLTECDVHFTRRSGPGGQHRNKVETAVCLRHRPSGVCAEANERRSQAENRTMAIFRLRLRLALEVRAERKLAESPSAAWRRRFPGSLLRISAAHDDFPAILAETLDVVNAAGADTTAAAAALGCTASQLHKLLQKEPRAWKLLTAWRQERGLRPLK